MKSTIVILTAMLALSGCQLLAPYQEEAADKVGEGFAEYCEQMPASERPAFKAQVEEACNCQVTLVCPGD